MDSDTGVNIATFLSADKSMIIAPAGFGKTHTIVDCLEKYKFEGKKFLILTHTHAGIASLKEKIASANISSKIYELTTICSFTLNLVLSFIPEKHLPDDSNMDAKYKKALEFARILLLAKPIQSVMHARYAHVIIDEYQDCNVEQHQLISLLGNIVKIHILGDGMQSIFGFNGTPVDLNGPAFNEYRRNLQTLATPWRWLNVGSLELGEEIHQIRQLLESRQEVDLSRFSHIQYVETRKNDFYWRRKNKNDIPPEILRILHYYLNPRYNGNVLVIHPTSFKKEIRVAFTKRIFGLGMLESIDDADFYNTVKAFENSFGDEVIAAIITFLRNTCIASSLGDWFHEDGSLKSIRKKEKLPTIEILRNILNPLHANKSYRNILSVITQMRNFFTLPIVRKDLYYTIERVLVDADRRKVSLLEALKLNRDKVRRIGRDIQGKYLGTTLLTKGLECETVIVLNANQFPDEKHLYVALSRCSKRLIVASESVVLSPYYKQNRKKNVRKPQQPSLFDDSFFA